MYYSKGCLRDDHTKFSRHGAAKWCIIIFDIWECFMDKQKLCAVLFILLQLIILNYILLLWLSNTYVLYIFNKALYKELKYLIYCYIASKIVYIIALNKYPSGKIIYFFVKVRTNVGPKITIFQFNGSAGYIPLFCY